MSVLTFVSHGRTVQKIASGCGWLPGARYTNLRDIRRSDFAKIGFLDIDWKSYDFDRHLAATKVSAPRITVARDVECIYQLDSILRQAEMLLEHAQHVVIVPKDVKLSRNLETYIPQPFLLGYSVPTRYGGTRISPDRFQRAVHLLGGRPDVQRRLGDVMPVFSLDCNRFTIDAAFGDYFDGELFRPHPRGGYERCIRESLKNIRKLWSNYVRPGAARNLSPVMS